MKNTNIIATLILSIAINVLLLILLRLVVLSEKDKDDMIKYQNELIKSLEGKSNCKGNTSGN